MNPAMFEDLGAEVRRSVRSLSRSPAYALTVICVLALAIGATVALFSVVHGVLLRPLPYRDPDRLVLIDETSDSVARLSVSYPDFLEWRQRSRSLLRVVLRTAVPPMTLARAAQSAITAIDPEQPIFDLSTMERVAASTLDRERFSVVLLCSFAGLALLVALTGLYGVMAYVVSRRSHEIGIRMALGADARAVRSMVLRQGIGIALVGVAIGAVVAAAVSRFVVPLVSGVKTFDPAMDLAVAIALVGVAIAAGWLPSRRATQVDPVVALREE